MKALCTSSCSDHESGLTLRCLGVGVSPVTQQEGQYLSVASQGRSDQRNSAVGDVIELGGVKCWTYGLLSVEDLRFMLE